MGKISSFFRASTLTFCAIIFFSVLLMAGNQDEPSGLSFGLWDALQILGSLAFFIYGMKLMSDGIQRAAGSQLRNILRTMTRPHYSKKAPNKNNSRLS